MTYTRKSNQMCTHLDETEPKTGVSLQTPALHPAPLGQSV